MKIIYCIHSVYNPGGMERVTLNKLRWLAERTDCELAVVTTDQHGRPPFYEFPDRVRMIDLGVNYSDDNGKNPIAKTLGYLRRRRKHRRLLTELLLKEKADIVVSLFPCESSFIPDIKDGSKKVLELHQGRFFRLQYARGGLLGLADRLRHSSDLRLVRKFDKFVVLTREDAGDWGQLPDMEVIPNAVPESLTSAVASLAPADFVRERPKRVMAVGRLDYQKGFDRLIDAWRIVCGDERLRGWHLDIFGQGEWKSRLLQMAADYGLEDRMTVHPPTPDIIPEYLSSSLFVMSSHYEGLPMVMIEAMACGLPAVSFDCKCGPKDIIDDGVNGLLVREGDVAGLAWAMKKLMLDDDLRREMSFEAAKVGERYSEERIMGQWMRLFNSLTRRERTLLQINPVVRRNTSTGRIMREIGDLAVSRGWKSYIAYSAGRDAGRRQECGLSEAVPVGSRLSVAWHGLMTRVFDRHGLSSGLATLRLISRIQKISPSIIQLHNIHGYFLNYPLFFRYLRSSSIPVVWTVHDCWLYTGHCYHYAFAGCYRWQVRQDGSASGGCGHCPQKRQFPASLLFDRSARNWKDKRAAFTSLKEGQLTIVAVSDWMRGEIGRSFLKGCRCRVIHNGIDTSAFAPASPDRVTALRQSYSLGDRHICLAVASIWSAEKGWDDLSAFAGLFNLSEEVLVVVGVSEAQRAALPSGVLGIGRTENLAQLAALYSAADAFVNFTYQDNYPTVNLESISCGTPVITYRTGGSVEAVEEGPDAGYIVPQGDYAEAYRRFREISSVGKEHFVPRLRQYALDRFRKEDRYSEYFSLYEELLTRS